MKVFLSWSGDRSKYIAETFRDWLPMVIQALDPWISVDIAKGQKWNDELTKALRASKVCILCLTSDNISSAYMHYEAGAIDSNLDSKNCTFLFDVQDKDVKYPLSAFQNTKFDRSDVYRLLLSINEALSQMGGVAVSEGVLKKTFDLHWPSLENDLKLTPIATTNEPERSNEDVLSEILTTVRRLDSQSLSNVSVWSSTPAYDPSTESIPFFKKHSDFKTKELIHSYSTYVWSAYQALGYNINTLLTPDQIDTVITTIANMHGVTLTVGNISEGLRVLRNGKG